MLEKLKPDYFFNGIHQGVASEILTVYKHSKQSSDSSFLSACVVLQYQQIKSNKKIQEKDTLSIPLTILLRSTYIGNQIV